MAKRFVDTDIWKHEWYSALNPKQKCLWRLICDLCDHVGIWPINLRLAGFYLGEEVTHEDLAALGFGSRLIKISDDKLWIPGFIKFQYKSLSPRNKAHLGIMRQIVSAVGHLPLAGDSKALIDEFKETLSRGSVDPQQTPSIPLVEGQVTPQEKEKEKEKEKDNSSFSLKPTEPNSSEIRDIPNLLLELQRTLDFFEIRKRASLDEVQVTRLVQRYPIEKVRAALVGARFEAKTDRFDPKANFSVQRLLNKPDIFEKCVNLGFQKSGVNREVFNPQTGKYEQEAS